jgi:hypothetical protein
MLKAVQGLLPVLLSGSVSLCFYNDYPVRGYAPIFQFQKTLLVRNGQRGRMDIESFCPPGPCERIAVVSISRMGMSTVSVIASIVFVLSNILFYPASIARHFSGKCLRVSPRHG